MSAEKEVVISCEQLSYQSGKKMLLNQINLQIKKGEHWLLYGENGSGKTFSAALQTHTFRLSAS